MRNASRAIWRWLRRAIRWRNARWDIFYYEGLGVEKDLTQAFIWTKRAAEHGDWDAQCNLAEFYEEGVGTGADPELAKYWYQQAAGQNHEQALKKCRELGITLEQQES